MNVGIFQLTALRSPFGYGVHNDSLMLQALNDFRPISITDNAAFVPWTKTGLNDGSHAV